MNAHDMPEWLGNGVPIHFTPALTPESNLISIQLPNSAAATKEFL